VKRHFRGESLDRIVAGALVVLAQIELWVGNTTPGLAKGLAVVVAIAIPSSIAVRRRWPLAVGVFVVLADNLIFLVGAHSYSVAVAVSWMCALYGVAVWTEARGFVIGLVVLAVANAVPVLAGHSNPRNIFLFTIIPAVVMVLVRRTVRDRQLLAESLAARAELLEREQERRAHEAIAEERARIARELHDLVAHNISVMVVQAGAERHALPDEQASTRETLSSIEQAGRQALAEARRLLGMLRPGSGIEELEPQPGLDQLGFLIDQVRRAGLPVKLEVDGDRVALPAGVDLCAYRVVQESLTNALKHAGPAQAEVRLRYSPLTVSVEVRDNGSGGSRSDINGAGHGLIGMNERVALYGGEFAAGPRETGGFEVRARIPIS
jgi:signal transduction histidine kinase